MKLKRFHCKNGKPLSPMVGEVVFIPDDNRKRVGLQKGVVGKFSQEKMAAYM